MNDQENLRDLFTDKWEDLLRTLSAALGFTLRIYDEQGEPIFIPAGQEPFCKGFGSASPAFRRQCDTYYHPFIAAAIKTGQPSFFKCHAGIVSFTLPIHYLDEKAAIVGNGSFESYNDLRDCINLLASFDIDPARLRMPSVFTTAEKTRKVCDFIANSVSRLLKNTQEAVTLRKKFESLKSVFSTGRSAIEEQPEVLFREMINKISILLDVDDIDVLMFDASRSEYASRYSLSKSRRQQESVRIGEHDEILRELYEGKAFVLSAEPVTDPNADFLVGRGALYFFPVMMNRKIEAIVRIEDRVLKPGDAEIVARFCNQTALAIENNRISRNLSRKLNRFAAISEVTRAISHIQNEKELLKIILDKSAELLNAERGSLMVIDKETDVLLLQAKMGIAEGMTDEVRINRGEGIAGKVVELGEPMLVENVEDDPRIMQKNGRNYKTRSFVSVPLKIENRVIGVLNLADKGDGNVFTEEDLKVIQSLATQAAVVIERNVFHTKNEELKKLTITDPLTGLLNRRYLYERLNDEIARSKRYGHHLSLLMLDLDGFKSCNDTLGHLFGDRTLIVIAEALMNAVRSMDIVARFGGDEFMIILPETGKPMAMQIAERIRTTVEQRAMMNVESAVTRSFPISTSIGIVCYPENGETIESLLSNADKALYRAKKNGKNRVEVFS